MQKKAAGKEGGIECDENMVDGKKGDGDEAKEKKGYGDATDQMA